MVATTDIQTLMRKAHEARVLTELRTNGPSSRAQLCAATNLSRTTLSDIVTDLLERDVIVVVDTDAGNRRGSGRPAEMLAVDPGSGLFLGFEFGHRRVVLAVAGAGHDLIASGTAEYYEDELWPERARIAVDLARRLEGEQGVHYGALQSIAAGVIGRSREVAEPVVAKALSAAFGVSVAVDNNVRHAGLAEAVAAGTGLGNVVYLHLSDGVGGAVIVNGRLVQGHERFAGELGHIVVDPQGRRCRCGKRGCLETLASIGAVADRAHVRGEPHRPLEPESGAPELQDAVAAAASAAGQVLGAVAMVLNPELIVVGGQLVHLFPSVVDRIEQVVRATTDGSVGSTPRIRPASEGAIAGALGGIIGLLHESPLLAGYDNPIFNSPHQHDQRRELVG